MSLATQKDVEVGRREQLLRAARTVFAEKGYHRATVGDIVRQAGVAQGTFYLYFPSKQAVLATLAHDFRNALLAELFDSSLDTLPRRDRARAMVQGVFRVSRANPDLVRALHMGVDVWEAARMAAESGDSVIEEVTAFIRGHVDQATLGSMSLDIVARMICRLVEAASLECFVLGRGDQVEQYEDTLVEMIDRIFGASS